MIENKKKLRQQHNLRQVFELGGNSCIALTSFEALNNDGYTAHCVSPNPFGTSYSPKSLPINKKYKRFLSNLVVDICSNYIFFTIKSRNKIITEVIARMLSTNLKKN